MADLTADIKPEFRAGPGERRGVVDGLERREIVGRVIEVDDAQAIRPAHIPIGTATAPKARQIEPFDVVDVVHIQGHVGRGVDGLARSGDFGRSRGLKRDAFAGEKSPDAVPERLPSSAMCQ